METAVTAIQTLHDKKLAVDFLTHDQLVALYNAVNTTATNEGYTLLPKQISDLFQIEASYLRHERDIVIILHVPCVNKDEIMKVYRHLPFPIPIPKQILHHDMTIRQSMLSNQLSNNDFNEFFNQSDLSFPAVEEALFITDKNDLIAIGKNDAFKVISQVELAACIQKGHIYLCDKHQVLGNDIEDSCLESLYIRSEIGVQKHCNFDRRPVTELVYQINDFDHLVYSPNPKVYTMYCKNGTRQVFHLEKASKIHIDENCHIKLAKHTIKSDNSINLHANPLTFSWAFDALEMPALAMENAQHSDFILNKMRSTILELESQTTNATKLEDLLIKSVTGGSKIIAAFFWATSIFVLFTTAFKLWTYGTVIKNFALKIWRIKIPAVENDNMNIIMYQQQQAQNIPGPNAPHF